MTAKKWSEAWMKLFTTTTKKVNDKKLLKEYKALDSQYKKMSKRTQVKASALINKQISNLMRQP